jgi:glycosyltransferase involved in cell wall biosynthesis
MKNVIFFFDNEWAFGSIHYGLFKHLWGFGYNCNLLPWDKVYTKEEIAETDSHIDCWVTSPHGLIVLKQYNIDLERCIVIAHSVFDLTDYIERCGKDDFDKVKKYGVISNYLKDFSNGLNISREPIVYPVGINYNSFYAEPSNELKIVGYASAYYAREEFTQEMIDNNQVANLKWKKRGYLVKEVAEKIGLEFRVAAHYHNSFVTMPGFYKAVDAVIISSMQEGGGLPALEAGAAGNLVISTPVGYWKERAGGSGGIQVPIGEKEFVEYTTNALNYYKDRPTKYREKCYAIREHAKSYDWSNYVEQWAKEF